MTASARRIDTRGKGGFDTRIANYNRAALRGPWLALRDSDRDSGDCPAALRQSLLSEPQSPALSLRLAVRAVEAWLLADREAFAEHFAVPIARVPLDPEGESNPKTTLSNCARRSRRREVREGVAAPAGSAGTGPEYSAFMLPFARDVWRPDVAAEAAPSLHRALREIDRLVAEGTWS